MHKAYRLPANDRYSIVRGSKRYDGGAIILLIAIHLFANAGVLKKRKRPGFGTRRFLQRYNSLQRVTDRYIRLERIRFFLIREYRLEGGYNAIDYIAGLPCDMKTGGQAMPAAAEGCRDRRYVDRRP